MISHHFFRISRHRIYPFLKLDKKSVKANIKLACQYRVKQHSVIQLCINLRFSQLNYHFVMPVFSYVSTPELSPEFSLFLISNLNETDFHVADWLLDSLCFCSSHRHDTDLRTHWKPCKCNWFVCSCSLWNGQHKFLYHQCAML